MIDGPTTGAAAITAGGGATTVTGGAGAVSVAGGGSLDFVSGTGAATVGGAGFGAVTLTGGSGASTIVGRTGNAVFGFVNGHAGGTETIYNFHAGDNLAFEGYGYSLTNAAMETIVNGNDVMTLNDGTSITFIGLDHKIF